MDCLQQKNSLYSQDNHESIIKSQITTFGSRNSSKGDSSKQNKLTSPTTGSTRTTSGNPKTKAPNYKLSKKPTITKPSNVDSVTTRKEQKSKKMSDWGDEEATEVIGKGFGTDNEVYKSNDDEYQNEDYNGNHKMGFNGGRNGGGRGRGRNGGSGFNRYNKNGDDYEENGESNAHVNVSAHEHYQNSIFALIPNDFLQENLRNFMNNMPTLFRKATLVQKYTIMKYLMEAYEKILKKLNGTRQDQPETTIKTTYTKNKDKETQILQKNCDDSDERSFAPTIRNEETDEEIFELLAEPEIISAPNNTMDLLEIYQSDLNNCLNLHNSLTHQHDNQLDFQENILLLSPTLQLPLDMNISELFKNDLFNINNSEDLDLSFLKQHQIQPQEQLSLSMPTENPLQTENAPLQDLTKERQAQSSKSTQRLRYNLISSNDAQSSTTTVNIPYQCETPPATPKRLNPQIFISEEEYSLRFRLPRRTFLEISEIPHVKHNMEISSLAYFAMDMTYIEDEYLSGNTDNVMPTSGNSLVEVQLQTSNTQKPLTTSSTLATTGDNLSSLNVRQATSSMMESSSFGKPLPPAVAIDVSRIAEESSHVVKDISSRVEEPVGMQNNDASASQESGQYRQPQLQQKPNVKDEAINLKDIEPPPQIATDSGIHFPTPNLLTTDGALINVSSGTKPVLGGSVSSDPSSSRDAGNFKTPIIPERELLQPITTLSSVEEHRFESTLKTRKFDVSTPVSILEPSQRKTLLSQIENANITDANPANEQIMPQNTVIQEPNLQPIDEVRESDIGHLNEGVINVQNQILQVEEVAEQMNVATGNNLTTQTNSIDDYRQDWYGILRARLQDVNYKNSTRPQHKPKHRRVPRRLIFKQKTPPQEELDQQLQNNVATSELLQRTLAGILPIVNENFNITNSSAAPDPARVGDISSEQQQYDQFIVENIESITTIIENLNSCRIMLDNHRLALQAKLSIGVLQQSCQHFDPDVLLNASKKRLSVKLGLLQNIIRQVSFDFTKCDCINDRMSAAMGFAFLLEMKSAGIINLSSDGRTVTLR